MQPYSETWQARLLQEPTGRAHRASCRTSECGKYLDERRAKYIRRMMAEIEELRRNNYVYRFLCMAQSNICWVS